LEGLNRSRLRVVRRTFDGGRRKTRFDRCLCVQVDESEAVGERDELRGVRNVGGTAVGKRRTRLLAARGGGSGEGRRDRLRQLLVARGRGRGAIGEQSVADQTGRGGEEEGKAHEQEAERVRGMVKEGRVSLGVDGERKE
jgi:hypothetical protein